MKSRNNEVKNYLYLKAWDRVLKEYTENPDVANRIQYIQRLVFYGVKFVTTKLDREYLTKEQVEHDFQLISIIKSLAGLVTPSEFMNIFPIEKEYKGNKLGMKDYFYTRDYINTLNPNEPIGEEILHFIWEYHNWDIIEFNTELMSVLSKLRQFYGYPSLGQAFADMNGIKTQTLHTGSNGQEFFIDDRGKTVRAIKKRPRYLKLVK